MPEIDWRKPQPAPAALARVLRANFPIIRATGIYNDRNVAGKPVKSAHAEGRALDIHLNAGIAREKRLGDLLFEMLMREARVSGIDNVIWNRQIWSTRHPTIRPYPGASPHTDHIHVEFTRPGSQSQVLQKLELRIAELRTGLEDLGGL